MRASAHQPLLPPMRQDSTPSSHASFSAHACSEVLPWGQVVELPAIDYRQIAEELCECVLTQQTDRTVRLPSWVPECPPASLLPGQLCMACGLLAAREHSQVVQQACQNDVRRVHERLLGPVAVLPTSPPAFQQLLRKCCCAGQACACPPTALQQSMPSYVRAEGTQLLLEGQPFRFAGFNAQQVGTRAQC